MAPQHGSGVVVRMGQRSGLSCVRTVDVEARTEPECVRARAVFWEVCQALFALVGGWNVPARHPPQGIIWPEQFIEPTFALVQQRQVRAAINERMQGFDALPYRHIDDDQRVVENTQRSRIAC
ncbi:MAG: hypothetical protein RL701_6647, partial [Pseudomonadota bacterium]